jgi:hypothetical protein
VLAACAVLWRLTFGLRHRPDQSLPCVAKWQSRYHSNHISLTSSFHTDSSRSLRTISTVRLFVCLYVATVNGITPKTNRQKENFLRKGGRRQNHVAESQQNPRMYEYGGYWRAEYTTSVYLFPQEINTYVRCVYTHTHTHHLLYFDIFWNSFLPIFSRYCYWCSFTAVNVLLLILLSNSYLSSPFPFDRNIFEGKKLTEDEAGVTWSPIQQNVNPLNKQWSHNTELEAKFHCWQKPINRREIEKHAHKF